VAKVDDKAPIAEATALVVFEETLKKSRVFAAV